MPETREQIREKKRRLKARYGKLYVDVAALLFRHDPIGINFEDNTDEYETETGTILPRLRECQSAADVTGIVHQEFQHWFSPIDAGPLERYGKIGEEIWQLWQTHCSTEHSA